MQSDQKSIFRTKTLSACAPCRRRKMRCSGGNPCLPCARARTNLVCEYPPGVGVAGHRRLELPKGGACIQCRERKRKCDGQLPCETCSNASRPHLCEYRAKKGKERSYWRDGSPSADSTSSSQSSSRVLWIEPTVVYANGIASRPPQSARRSSRSSTSSWPRRESVDSFLDYPISSPALNLSSQLSLPATGYEVFPLPPSNFDAVWSDDAIDEYIALLDMHISLPQCSLELDPPVDAWPCGL